MKQVIEFKSMAAQGEAIKDVDVKKGIVTGYFSIFGNIDSDNDIIVPGAFKKTLSENYRRIKHLYQHDPWRPLAGTKDDRLKIQEDSKGLYFESAISQTSYGRDVVQLYQDGVLDEHSVGFQTMRSNDKAKHRELIELKLFEGSSVTWGANELAQGSAMKSVSIETALNKSDKIIKALRDGRYETDEVWDMLEIYLKQLHQTIIDLSAGQPTQTLQQAKASPPPARLRNWDALPSLIHN